MTTKATLIITFAMAAIYFAIGWVGHDWAIRYVVNSLQLKFFAASVAESFRSLLFAGLSLGLAGVAVGFGAWFGGRSSIARHVGLLLVLGVMSAVAAVYWLTRLRQRLSDFTTQVADLPDTLLPLSALSLDEVGLFASAVVLGAAGVAALQQKLAASG